MVHNRTEPVNKQNSNFTYRRHLERICGAPVVNIMTQAGHKQRQHFNISVK